ncbi:MAG: hypothetical protein KDA89_04430 [Planctomycetaceae bacterium]|nr:hypothetical protein [Planctomycetaceae bacterium]
MHHRHTLLRAALTLGLLATVSPARAQDAEDFDRLSIIRVEEDWMAYINNPDPNTEAPQIANLISPVRSTDAPFGMVELNHRSLPSFSPGGHQVQTWLGEANHDVVTSSDTAELSIAYDKLEYTVAMELSGDRLLFTLKDGRSRTWGRFAHRGVTAISPSLNLTLKDYDPQFSVDNTTVNVGAHRVELVYQREVRYYSADRLEYKDTTPRILHRFKDVVQFVSLAEYEQNEQYFNIEITE